jgi:D-beta-D-heptose 7-phosphate kinase/D-beta-D-heptose 1-phosphate adenosyltransferase
MLDSGDQNTHGSFPAISNLKPMGKRFSKKEIKEICERERRKGKIIVFTNGCFDILHPGHIRLFKFAKSKGDILVVGINTDSSVRKNKGEGRPIFPLKERIEVLSSISFIDYIVPFKSLTPLSLIKAVKPKYIVKGGDYKPEEVVGKKEVEKLGGGVIIFPYVGNYSTTEIIERIKK